MRLIGNLIVIVLIVLHLGFFTLETFLYESYKPFRAKLGFNDAPSQEAIILSQNQGVSNAFLSIGLALGLYWHRRGEKRGLALLRFTLFCIAVAGVVGFLTVRPEFPSSLAFLLGQTGLGLLGLLLVKPLPISD